MQRDTFAFYSRLFVRMTTLCLLLTLLAACTGDKTNPSQQTNLNTNTGDTTAALTPGRQACPVTVSTKTYWEPIVPTQAEINTVEDVFCAHLINNETLQAIVLVRTSPGENKLLDIHIYNNITNPTPTKIFMLQGLTKGKAALSSYNTLMTSESNIDSVTETSNPIFREFKWSGGAKTLLPVAFPGIFPHMTRYEAEQAQKQINAGEASWKTNIKEVATRFVKSSDFPLNWTTDPQINVSKGGQANDTQAIVTAKNGEATLTITLDRLGGNTKNGMWIVTGVSSEGMEITTPKNLERISNTTTIAGKTKNQSGTIQVLNSSYKAIGSRQISGEATFSTTVEYKSSYRAGLEEGAIVLSTGDPAGSANGIVIYKSLLSYGA